MKLLTEATLAFVLNAVWQILLISLLGCACAWLLRTLGARYIHHVWVTALMLGLLIPLLSCASQVRLLLATARQPELHSAISVGPVMSLPVKTPALEAIVVKPAQQTRTERIVAGLFSPIKVNRNLGLSLSVFYLAFLLYQGARLFRAWLRTKAIVRNASPVEPAEHLSAILSRCLTAAGVRRVSVLSSASIAVPITAGVLRAVIILPEKLIAETDQNLLTSAIGHELIHVARRDYLLNLIYELVYLPISFHPAARFIRRRIKQTRELCCDERVTHGLLNAQAYAQSLMRLIGAAPLTERLAADTTIGINESDNLEVRIMSLLKTRRLAPRHKSLLLTAAAFLLIVPCLAAPRVALAFEVGFQDPSTQLQSTRKVQIQEVERARAELERNAEQLREQIRVAQDGQRPELEKQLRDVQRNLTQNEQVLRQYEAQMAKEETWRQVQQEFAKNRAAQEAQMREASERLAQLMTRYPQPNQQQLEELQRAQREFEVLAQEQAQDQKEKEEKLKSKEQKEREKQEWKEKEEREKQEWKEKEERETPEWQEKEAREKREIEERELRGAGLAAARWAKIPMTQAIQIATSKYPGTVLQCRLFGEREDKVFYQVVIATDQGDDHAVKYVWVNAIDGQIIKTDEEKTRERGGRLKLIRAPNPEYPAIARAARVSGEVSVEVTVDEQGNVIAAKAVSGHPLLQSAAVSAAREAKFEPAPGKVTGLLTFNFEP